MTTKTVAPPQIYNSKVLDHLGLVSGMFDELGLGELIDQLIPQNHEKRNVSVGQAVKAMVLNGLGFMNHALYLTPIFFDCQQLSAEELIAAYKDQQKVERGFRFLKDPLFMASTLFLESPRRIMAL